MTEHLETIQRAKEVEILRLHKILVRRYLKYNYVDLCTRTRILNLYYILITEDNIEKWYNLPVDQFIVEFLNCKTL